MKNKGYVFDGSGVSKGPALPIHASGLYQFGLPTISEGPQNRPVIAMDYNLFVRHSGGFERTDHQGEFENRAYAAFKGAFERQYEGQRIPFQIGLHFHPDEWRRLLAGARALYHRSLHEAGRALHDLR